MSKGTYFRGQILHKLQNLKGRIVFEISILDSEHGKSSRQMKRWGCKKEPGKCGRWQMADGRWHELKSFAQI